MKKALKGLSRSKAGGVGSLSIDLIEDAGDFLLDKLVIIFYQLLANLFCTKYLEKYYIILIYKKGNITYLKKLSSNMSTFCSIQFITKVLTNKITAMMDSNHPKEQTSFRCCYSTTGHIHVIYQVIMKKINVKHTKLLCMAFIDYENFFDSVETSAVMKAFRKQGLEEMYVKILKYIYKKITATL